MTPGGTESEPGNRWDRLREAFDELLAAAAHERAGIIERVAQGDPGLRGELEELIEHDEEAGDFLAETAPAPALSASAQISTGATIGEFELVRPLGAGGMGTVWEARGERPKRTLALKLMRLGLFSDREVRRFEFEAEVLARLQHPAIAQVYASGTHDEGTLTLPWFALELIPGARDLVSYAVEEGLSTAGRLALFAQICDAIAHAHARGVLHRDLKPGNVLVGDDGRPRVIDFGIARARDAEGAADLTQAGQIVGTLQYMAPEQLSGADPSGGNDTRVDVYALGVLLYELLCETGPYDLSTRSLPEILRILADESPRKPSEVDPALPLELEWIILRAMEKDRERRYASVAELAEDVRRFGVGEPLSAGPPSVHYRLRKFVGRHRALVTAASLIFLSLLAGAIGIGTKGAQLAIENGRVKRLSDARILDDLERRSEQLYPASPERAEAMEQWLREAAVLAARLPEHSQVLEELRGRALPGEVPLAFEQQSDAWWFETQAELVARLESFVHPRQGRLADVEERYSFATSVEQATVGGARAQALWARAQRSIADPEGPYGGLQLAPQLGLLPLGADPSSGLWEFLHLRSAGTDALERGAAALGGERYAGAPRDSGVVFVLLPGGTFSMGARPPSEEHPVGAPNVDPLALTQTRWGPVNEVELAPFFLSKFEVTQAQWERATHGRPSRGAPGGGFDPLAPVDHVSWFDAERTARQLALTLPTEAQWEYGVRAGTRTPFWLGEQPTDWSGVAWVGDILAGAATHPVGELPPNPFGLHDMLGNVQEWCADTFEDYLTPTRVGDGLRLPAERDAELQEQRILRGAFYHLPKESTELLARSAARAMDSPTARYERLGVRFARPIQ